MKCELLAEHNLALMLDFVDDENTKYDEAVLKAFLNEKNAYGYIAADKFRFFDSRVTHNILSDISC